MEPRDMKLEIERWKDQYGNVFGTEINDVWFIWRELSRGEFKKALAYYEDDHDRSEYVSRLCVLDPVGFDFSTEECAGIPETLAKEILAQSGFSEGNTKWKSLLQKHKKEMEGFDNQIACVIAECFPRYTLEEIEGWPMDKTMWYYSRAEWILEILRGVKLTQEDNKG